jgi:hypothetical protein
MMEEIDRGLDDGTRSKGVGHPEQHWLLWKTPTSMRGAIVAAVVGGMISGLILLGFEKAEHHWPIELHKHSIAVSWE